MVNNSSTSSSSLNKRKDELASLIAEAFNIPKNKSCEVRKILDVNSSEETHVVRSSGGGSSGSIQHTDREGEEGEEEGIINSKDERGAVAGSSSSSGNLHHSKKQLRGVVSSADVVKRLELLSSQFNSPPSPSSPTSPSSIATRRAAGGGNSIEGNEEDSRRCNDYDYVEGEGEGDDEELLDGEGEEGEDEELYEGEEEVFEIVASSSSSPKHRPQYVSPPNKVRDSRAVGKEEGSRRIALSNPVRDAFFTNNNSQQQQQQQKVVEGRGGKDGSTSHGGLAGAFRRRVSLSSSGHLLQHNNSKLTSSSEGGGGSDEFNSSHHRVQTIKSAPTPQVSSPLRSCANSTSITAAGSHGRGSHNGGGGDGKDNIHDSSGEDGGSSFLPPIGKR